MAKANNNNGGHGLGICDRCAMQFPYQALRKDGNSPGMLVCNECWDPIDPYRLPRKQDLDFIIKNPRPPEPLVVPGIYYRVNDNVLYGEDDALYGPEPQ